MPGTTQTVTVGGRRLKVSNLDKVLYPESGTTKAEVIAYYVEIAPTLLPYAQGRPVTRKRWPNGVGSAQHPGEVFFHKDIGPGAPDWVATRPIQHSDREVRYPVLTGSVDDATATLAWFAQLAALELHVPQWRFGADGGPQHPDRLVLDLDPGEGVGLAECAEVARLAREALTALGLRPYPVTSGSKGIHLYAALDGTASAAEVSDLAHRLARALEREHPDLVVSDMAKALRQGKVLVDWSQNNGAKTTIAPYSLRGTLRPQVAAPRTWAELDDPALTHLQPAEVLARLQEHGDLLAGLTGQHDRLDSYRRKRDPSRTPEPVPASRPAPSDGRTFVIQEHHARRLHWDLRLERHGVLASWALPKGVPASTKQNHLAVHTEDHPMEYATFSGVIPKGEYGGGEMTIWDAGSYELHTWREDEVIVTLHGRAGGGLGAPTKIALIHTGGNGRPDNHWLVHLMERGDVGGGLAETPSRRYRLAGSRAGSAADIPDETQWTFEMGWAGTRVLVEIEDRQISLFDQHDADVTRAYPDLLFPLRSLGLRRAVLDAHVIMVDGSRADAADGQDGGAAAFVMITDVLECDDRDLAARPYQERHEALQGLDPDDPHVQVPPAFPGTLDAALSAARQFGLAGIVAKRNDEDYPDNDDAWITIPAE